jgi:predicted dehydrogenase
MQIWSARAFAGIDFAGRTAMLVRPSKTLRRRQFRLDRLTPEQIEHQRQHFAEEHLPREQLAFDAVDALALEQVDFVEAIRTPRQPRVDGEAGRDALAVAEQILAGIRSHRWDASDDGPAGPLALPRSYVIPASHFNLGIFPRPAVHDKAG